MGRRMDWLRPRARLPAVTALTPQELRRRGLKGLLVDLDNTLVGWNRMEPGHGLRPWLDSLRQAGIPVCVLSNNRGPRVEAVCRALGLPAVASAGKPGTRGIRRALAMLGTAPEETALVGDRLLTDVLAGNRAGLYTVLVPALDRRHDLLFSRWLRALEDGLLARAGTDGWSQGG